MTASGVGSCRLIDLEQKTVTMLPDLGNKTERPTIINWTVDENQDMIVSRDLSNNGAVNIVLSRASGFKTKTLLEDSQHKQKGVTGAFVHPKTGTLYYTLYETQPMWRYDFATKEFTTFASHMRTKETLRWWYILRGNMRIYYVCILLSKIAILHEWIIMKYWINFPSPI